ncbi:MAG: CDP-alcohol phosphatidyltransferase family protein [Chloroflexota bacterium]|nr:CDP-alcohol phosphatidyltransferase family protein [Chloroflexota bacterium]
MANLITLGRLILFFGTVGLLYTRSLPLVVLALFLGIVVIASDALDGWVARRRRSASDFGSVVDIAGDRVVEQCYWIVFAHLGLIGVWAPLLVVTRGIVVDTLRGLAFREGRTAFGEKTMARSPLTEWLTASRTMRALYGIAKAAAFVFLTGLFAARLPEARGTLVETAFGSGPLFWLGWAFVALSLALTVVRGLPVIFDSWDYIAAGGRA